MPTTDLDWTLTGAEGQPILGTTDLPTGGKTAHAAVLLAHGFKGYKDYGLFPQLGARLSEAGFAALRFNFSHSGMTRNIETFERPELFEKDTWSKQVQDMQIVARAAAAGEIPGTHTGTRTAFFGHSRGGLTALLAADRLHAVGHRAAPAAVVAAAAPSQACNLDPDQQAMIRRRGFMEAASSRTGQVLHVGLDWLEDIETQGDRLNPLHAAAALTCPLLIVHGSDDPTVDPACARALHEANPRSELHLIEGASHTFNAPNPLPLETPPPPQTAELFDTVVNWLQAHLAD